jgi:DNA repair protein RadC
MGQLRARWSLVVALSCDTRAIVGGQAIPRRFAVDRDAGAVARGVELVPTMTKETTWAGPRERAMETGIECLSDAELLAILLGTGLQGMPVTVLAATLLDDHGGAAGLARAGIGELAEVSGVGAAKAARVAAAIELGRRATSAASLDASPKLPDRAAVEAWARPRLATLDHEELWVLALDGRHGLRAARRVASGGIHGLHVSARDPLRVALREAASAFVLVHNHPSGDPTPSDEDVAFTRVVAHGAQAVATPLLDHVIVARRRSTSMLEAGLLPPARAKPLGRA